jgi:hypothetical protein
VECISRYFDDLNLRDGYEYALRSGLVNESESEIVSDFHELADRYYLGKSSAEDTLREPAWMAVVAEARRAWAILKADITNADEIAMMRELERDWGI